MDTLYAKLGVPQDATGEEIKRAYRKAAMKWHPDRNAGREDIARATFQDIKDAYAILSDEDQRKVYDAVYAEEMRRWDAVQKREQAQEARRARAAQAAAEARYAQMVGVAMRYAEDGHNRDVLFGVLLGRECDSPLAERIADSVWAMHESRRAQSAAEARKEAEAHKQAGAKKQAEAQKAAEARSDASASVEAQPAEAPTQSASAKHEKAAQEQRTPGMFDSLWQGFFGLRS